MNVTGVGKTKPPGPAVYISVYYSIVSFSSATSILIKKMENASTPAATDRRCPVLLKYIPEH